MLPLLHQGSSGAFDAQVRSSHHFVFGAAVLVGTAPAVQLQPLKASGQHFQQLLSAEPSEAGRIRAFAAANTFGGILCGVWGPAAQVAEVVVESGDMPASAGGDAHLLARCTALVRGALLALGLVPLAARNGGWRATPFAPVDACVAAAGDTSAVDAAWLRSALWVPLAGGAAWAPVDNALLAILEAAATP
ncbi:hypothetical protein Rsub_03028 [Raphidocelis subcapitata]|uniref:Uncharacterized protein n=1 Tax=Raphidocelis subcapitata TaxID=307507 RepID=A0A2V0P0L1_9CHLO|nr:hypothetical protein Rsub_03028 [Raphidocelis subcapitata]|eukprot:GBF90727.1 hypothetical protein Rsub_03028 [Raphidocelis subcapitata]